MGGGSSERSSAVEFHLVLLILSLALPFRSATEALGPHHLGTPASFIRFCSDSLFLLQARVDGPAADHWARSKAREQRGRFVLVRRRQTAVFVSSGSPLAILLLEQQMRLRQ